MKTYAVTGHRPPKLGGYSPRAHQRLRAFATTVLQDVALKVPQFTVITGMALGWDQAVAQACVDIGIPFIAAVPFTEQASRWPAESQDRYEILLNQAHSIHVVAPTYSAVAMQQRNQWMVDHSDKLWALWDGSDGGTGNCVTYARSISHPMHNLWSRWVNYQNFALL